MLVRRVTPMRDSDEFDAIQPEYAKQHFVCSLNPVDENGDLTKQLIREGHMVALARLQRRSTRG